MTVSTKKELYSEQQYEILLKILRIIGISKEVNQVERSNIERSEVLEQINGLKGDISKHYSVRKWNGAKYGVNTEINFIRNIVKEFSIELLSLEKRRRDIESNKYKAYRVYKFIIPESILNDI